MQRYNPELEGRHHLVAEHSGAMHDQGSTGSDDDAGYLGYHEVHKMEPDVEDDPNTALTSQTLNADGTPKRPMNAFMIFARRRRPQVATENQSMRTGEVSKVLSREWNAMSLTDKQFYLDQAKLLKDNFNQKYPDYVYKRRPNNSRRRRKADPGPSLPADHPRASTSDHVDDYPGSADYSDVSPVDVADTDDSRYSGHDVRYSSLPEDSSSTYSGSQSRASSYQPPEPYRPLGDTRVPYVSSRAGRATPDAGSSISSASRASDHGSNYYHPYLSVQQQHHAQSSSYFPESSSAGDVWSTARDDQSRMQIQPWPQSSQDIGGDDTSRHRGYAQPVSSHAWANTNPSEAMPPPNPSGAPAPGYAFPTLTSPFYPSQSSTQEGFPTSSVQSISVPSQHYGAVTQMQGNPPSGRSYSSLQQAYPSGSTTAIGAYQQPPRTAPVTNPHPSGQPASSYPVQPVVPSSPTSDPSHMRYWPRDR